MQTFQSGNDYLPFRGVNHHRNTGNLRLRSNQIEESSHFSLCIQQAVVHIYIHHLRPVFYLLTGNAEGFIVFLFINQTQELAGTGHIAAFSHIDKVLLRSHFQQFQAGKPKTFGFRSRNMGSSTGYQGRIFGDVCIGRTTATANDVYQPFLNILFHFMRHIGRRLVILSQAVGQPRIGICTDIIRSTGSKLFQERFQLAGAKRAVQAYRKDIGMLNRGKKSLQSLSRQSTSSCIGYGNGQHNRNLNACSLHRLFRSKDSCFGIQCIEYGFYQQSIHSTFQQSFHLFPIGIGKFIVSQRTHSRIIHIGTHGASLIGRSDRAGYKTWFIRCRKFISYFTCQFNGSQIHLTYIFLHMIIGHTDTGRTKRIGFNDIGTCHKIFTVYILYHIRARQAKQIIVSFHLPGDVSKALPPEVFLR